MSIETFMHALVEGRITPYDEYIKQMKQYYGVSLAEQLLNDPFTSRGGEMRLRRITPNVTCLDLRDATFLFLKGELFAVRTGGAVYSQRQERTSAETKALYWLQDDEDIEVYPAARVSPEEFRFVVGSTLTKEGLPLTRLEKKT